MQTPLSAWSLRERLALAVVALTLSLLGLGAWTLRRQRPPALLRVPEGAGESILIDARASATPSPSPPPVRVRLVVYVTGAVRRPGVYTLGAGDRIFQAVAKAGGFGARADREGLNLAERLRDADHIRVPRKETLRSVAPTERTVGAAPGGVSATPRVSVGKLRDPSEGTVDLNRATAEDLMRLPGVGPSTAEAILEYRRGASRFSRVEEIKNVRGIGEKKYTKMAPFLSAP